MLLFGVFAAASSAIAAIFVFINSWSGGVRDE
jgi:hypothetical protein